MKYTKEYIEYIQKYPFIVKEDYRNGIKNELVFTDKEEALSYIEREKVKHKRTKFEFIENKLNPEYLWNSKNIKLYYCILK